MVLSEAANRAEDLPDIVEAPGVVVAMVGAEIPVMMRALPHTRLHWTAAHGLEFRANQRGGKDNTFPQVMGVSVTGTKESSRVTVSSHSLLGLDVFDLGRGYTNVRTCAAHGLAPESVTFTGGRIRGSGVLTHAKRDLAGILRRWLG